MSKKVPISPRPTQKTPDDWITSGAEPDAVAAPPEPAEPIMRMTFDLPKSVHGQFKSACSLKGTKMTDELRRFVDAFLAENKK